MGCNVRFDIENALIHERNHEAALKAINELYDIPPPFISLSEAIEETTRFYVIFYERDGETYLMFDYFEGSLYDEDVEVLHTLAPYFEEGAIFNAHRDEDNYQWRYVFEDGCCFEEEGIITYVRKNK